MEGREERDPGYDDWFDEPEPLTETASNARGVYDDADEVWVLPEDEGAHPHGRREIVIAGRMIEKIEQGKLHNPKIVNIG